MTPDEAAIERMARALHAQFHARSMGARQGVAAEDAWERLSDYGDQDDWREAAHYALAALLAVPPPAVERAVLERLLTELAEMRQHYRGNPYLAERVQWTADWLRDKRAALAQEESDG